jgi:hypothetical protein
MIMEEITIGILIPNSGIMPMGKQFDRALKKALKAELAETEFEPEILTETVGQGSPVLIEKALDDFFGYHDVDLVAGLVTPKAIEGVVDRFEKRNIPFIMNNLGEHLIPTKGYGDNVLVNSTHLWQHCFAMGQYAAQNLGKKGLVLGAMFDSGYAFLNCFQLGLMSVDQDFDHDLKLLQLPQPGKLSEVKEAFDSIDIGAYDFVFPLFCGEEATLFIEEFHARGLNSKTKIVALPFLFAPEKYDLAGLEMISTQNALSNDALWKNTFVSMGDKCGKAIGRVLVGNNGKLNVEELKKNLESLDSSVSYDSTQVPKLNSAITILSHKVVSGNNVETKELAQVDGPISENEHIVQSRDALASVWMNSYLAV